MSRDGRNPHLAALRPYVPADPPGIVHRLDANEAPPLDDPGLRALLEEALARVPLERYPDARATRLREALGAFAGVPADGLLVGTGSDELIALLFEAWNAPPPGAATPTVLLPSPTFVMYRMNALVRGWDVVEVPCGEDFRFDVPALLAACERHRPNLVFLATPNNPTGLCLQPEDALAIARACPWGLVVVDEAYVAFSSAPRLPMRAAGNLVRLGTLSKIGLAALRIGWLDAGPEVLAAVDVARAPFNTSATSQAMATALLERAGTQVRAHCAAIVRERGRLAAALAGLGPTRVHPSEANFLWIEPPRPPAEVWSKLAARGVLVRSFAAHAGPVARGLRITVGAQASNDALLEAYRAALAD